MTPFRQYSKFYDLLYGDKEYDSETDYIESLFESYSDVTIKSILDVGCGTGGHARCLASRGYSVLGIDRSSEMVEIAKSGSRNHPNVRYHRADATRFSVEQKFDASLSLFHVISYLTDNETLIDTFTNISHHLCDHGLFIFDFWYGPAVLRNPPESRIKNIDRSPLEITRTATPTTNLLENTVAVHYDLVVKNRDTSEVSRVEETHSMRFLFYPELKLMLSMAGFLVVGAHEWMNGTVDLNADNWNGMIVAKKKSARRLKPTECGQSSR